MAELDSEYWNRLYLEKDTFWDKGQVSPPIARMLRTLPGGGSLLVIGAGTGHEAVEAARLGFVTTGLDFAPEAAKAMELRAAEAKVSLTVACLDLFEAPGRLHERFDFIVEHTCFCAIPVERRDEYVKAVRALLKPGGALLGLFYAHGREGGPPFDTTDAEIRKRFSADFTVEKLAVAPDSFEARAGKELEFIFRAA